MKTVRAKKGPVSQRPFFSRQEVELTCSSELRKCELLPDAPAPIRIDRFIEKRFNISHEYQDVDSKILGYTKFGPRGVQQIVVSRELEDEGDEISERRLRTTLAHEAGHGLLHAYIFSVSGPKSSDPKVLCRDVVGVREAGVSSYDGEWWEVQANMAMSALLLPQALVLVAIEPFLETAENANRLGLTPEGSERAARRLAELFEVNPVVARLRLQEIAKDLTETRKSFLD